MKIVALIEDGQGHLHLLASRSPDLVRRDLSARTGTATLLWCAVPPEGVGANTVIAEALQRLGANGPEALAKVPVGRIMTVLTALCVIDPRRKARWRSLRQWRRGIAHRLHRPWRDRLATTQSDSLRI